MMNRGTWILILAGIFIFQTISICTAAEKSDDEKVVPKDEEDNEIDVQIEEEKDEKKEEDGAKKKDGEEKKGDKEDDEELPKTIRIGDKDIPIERADRTVTAEVTMEISFGSESMGNVTFGLFGRQCPKTVRNFVTLANPVRPKGEGYKGSKIHRIVKGFAVQGGDFMNNDGSGGWSIYGKYFRDENFAINHFPFCLSMANSGPNTNGSQFFVPVIRTSWLDGKHVVFGQVTSGHKLIKSMNDIRVNRFGRPYRQVWVSDTWTKFMKVGPAKSEL
ncbi:peptidyl-prolyl cis-trans isomerase-like [Styela clava]